MERTCVAALIFVLLLSGSPPSTATYFTRPFYNRCRDPGVPRNGFRRGNTFGVGYSVRFGCNSGYRLIGSPQATCMFMKYTVGWSTGLPLCVGELYIYIYSLLQLVLIACFPSKHSVNNSIGSFCRWSSIVLDSKRLQL